jgi:ribosomal protein S6--L-glutamate ligase
MKILILTRVHDHSVSRIVHELKIHKEKPDIEVISPVDLYAYISASDKGHDRIYRVSGEETQIKSKDFDCVIPRIAGTEIFEHGLMLVKHINENMRKFSTGTETGLRAASNKFRSCQILSANRIRVPRQLLTFKPKDFKEILDLVNFPPAVGKTLGGSKGAGVFWMDSEIAASTTLQSFNKSNIPIILNQYIDTGTPKGDLRVFVVGAETKDPKVFAYKKFTLAGDFRANYSLSKSGEKVDLTEEERTMAIDSAKIFRLGIAGVDVMRDSADNGKPYVIEVNGNPGLQGVEEVTGENVAGAIADYVLGNYKKGGRPLNARTYLYQDDLTNIVFDFDLFLQEKFNLQAKKLM